ncbi:MAG: GNAT family N-acetyltransferase [Burkholderiaceae bacterium]|nr:GNAT family N-acetyltransferase [Burkholderiaceae bacterium]
MNAHPLHTDHDWQRDDGYVLSTRRGRLDMDFIHHYLSVQSYWSQGISRARVERAVQHSLPFGVYAPSGEQAGFARLVTDYSVFGYLRDVFVVDAHQGRGLARWIAAAMQTHPALADVGSWLLATRDAHSVYARTGFSPVAHPEWYMQIRKSTD